MVTKLGFEGVVGHAEADGVPPGYGGLDWSGFDAEGAGLVGLGSSEPNGYRAVLHGDVVAYVGGASHNVSFSDSDSTFTLKRGLFAAAWNTSERVTFTAFLDGVAVGHQTVTMNQSAQTVHFSDAFRHVDEVKIFTRGGHDANPEDGGTGSQVALDNLIFNFDAAAAAPHDHHVHAPDSFMPHVSDWPLA